MLVRGTNYCLGCMKKIPEQMKTCSCGYDESTYRDSALFLPAGTILNGSYMVGRVIGTGGFGITYMGVDLDLDLKVAIKEFYLNSLVTRNTTMSNEVTVSDGDALEDFEKSRKRFLDEARMLARLHDEPGVVMVHKFFQENNTAYIVMEYLEGEDLKSYLQHHGKMTPNEMVQVFLPIMDSLQKVHELGLIHRDISPDNIMITKAGNVKLLDFGATRETVENQSLTVVLKHGYAPFEQYLPHENKQGPWTDVYALAATMYYALTLTQLPSATERLYDSGGVLMPSAISGSNEKTVDVVIMKALSVYAEDRYQSVAEMKEALLTTLSDENATVLLGEKEKEKEKDKRKDQNGETNCTGSGKERRIPKWGILLLALLAVLFMAGACLGMLWSRGRLDGGINDSVVSLNKSDSYLSWENAVVGKKVQMGTFEDHSLSWTILDVRENQALLLCDEIVAQKQIYDVRKAISWEKSNLREWLRTDFLQQAFTPEQRALIVTSHTFENDDDISILSRAEVKRYEQQIYAMGASTTFDGEEAWWWTRTQEEDSDERYYMIKIISDKTGESAEYCNYASGGVRPAIWIAIQSEAGRENRFQVGDTIELGMYDNEAIEWEVLDISEEGALLFSRYVLEERPYQDVLEDVTWEDCDLRVWLNMDFYLAAFSEEERSWIQNHHGDIVSLLSADDLTRYFSSIRAAFTIDQDTSHVDYWLRTDEKTANPQLLINTRRAISAASLVHTIADYNGGVRPIIWVKKLEK